MANKADEFEFQIQAFSPETMPMARLAEYMSDLARILGESNRVHFVRIRKGSTAIVHAVETEAVPAVLDRARFANSESAPPDVRAAARQMTNRLRSDNATGASLVSPTGEKLLEFKLPPRIEINYPVISEPGFVQGQVVRLGGSGDWVPVHLEDIDGQVYICEAKREKTRELAPFYLNGLIRAKGLGRWARLDQGGWKLDNFRIHDFEQVRSETLIESVERLRTITPADWQDRGDPLTALEEIRRGSR